MKDELIKVIAEYLEADSMDRFKTIYANRLHIKVTLGDISRYQSPPNPWPDDCVAIKSRRGEIAFLESESTDLKNEIAAEIAEKLLPIVSEKDFPYGELFDHIANEHGLTLNDTDLSDIIHIARGGGQKTGWEDAKYTDHFLEWRKKYFDKKEFKTQFTSKHTGEKFNDEDLELKYARAMRESPKKL